MALDRPRILVVEDESKLRALVRRRAANQGIDVLEAATSAQGLAVATAGKPDAVLIDLHLPDGNGLNLVAQLKVDPRTSSIPTFVWSGDDAATTEAAALRAGATAYFEKTDLNGLVARIAQIVQPR